MLTMYHSAIYTLSVNNKTVKSWSFIVMSKFHIFNYQFSTFAKDSR